MEPVVLVNKTAVVGEDDEACSSDNKIWSSDGQPLPEIEARVCGKSILLKILCQKRRGVLVKILAQVEEMNLAVVATSVAPFGDLTLDVTVTAEMEKEMDLSTSDIVKTLRSALQAAADN